MPGGIDDFHDADVVAGQRLGLVESVTAAHDRLDGIVVRRERGPFRISNAEYLSIADRMHELPVFVAVLGPVLRPELVVDAAGSGCSEHVVATGVQPAVARDM